MQCPQEPILTALSNILETIQLPLPPSITQNPNLDTSKYRLLPTLKINPQLHNIPILDSKRLTLLPRLTQSDMIQKGTRRAFHIFHPPTRIVPEKLAVPARNDFGFEPDGRV